MAIPQLLQSAGPWATATKFGPRKHLHLDAGNEEVTNQVDPQMA